MKPTAWITGATSGIGWATAFALAETHRLVLCGRRQHRLDELQQQLEPMDCQVLKLCFDVGDRSMIEQLLDSLPETWKQVDVLINNAGNAHGLEPFQEASIDDFENMIDSNLRGVLLLTHKLIPMMPRDAGAQIINISSIAGREAYPNGHVYCATKFAIEALTRGLRVDLLPLGIRVSTVSPGLVNTEFSTVRFKGDVERADAVYDDFTPLYAEDIARTIAFIIAQPIHVNIADVLVLPTAQADARTVRRDS